MSRDHARFILLSAVFALVAVPSLARAEQDPSAAVQSAAQTGPLVLTPIGDAIVFAPDVKVTTINDSVATLTGAYVGKLFENRVLVGGGAYWLVDPRDTSRLFYAGLVVGGRLLGTGRATLSARSLFGIGHAELLESIRFTNGPEPFRHGARVDGHDVFVAASDDFWMADPELRLALMINTLMSLDLGAGYRLTAARHGFNDALHGPTGSIGIRFNFE